MPGTIDRITIDLSAATGILPVANGGTGAASNANKPLSVFAAGTAYTLTAVQAAVTFGTTSPALTIDAPGMYLVIARSKAQYNAATFLANRSLTTKLRRTNNMAADLTNGSTVITTDIITTITGVCADQTWMTIYNTSNSDDSLSLFSALDVIPTAGSLQINEASIIAIKLIV